MIARRAYNVKTKDSLFGCTVRRVAATAVDRYGAKILLILVTGRLITTVDI